MAGSSNWKKRMIRGCSGLVGERSRLCRVGQGLVLAGIITGCSSPVFQAERPVIPQTIHFSEGDLGKAPTGFTATLTGGGGPPSWMVREDADAPGGGPVLAQTSAEVINYRFPLCIFDNTVARDIAVETKFKAISGTLDQSGGLVLRYTPGNYYIARANALENNVILFKTVKGLRSHVKEVPIPVSLNVWHTLRFEARGEHLEIIFDGKTVLKKNDGTFTGPGKAGLWTKADSVTEFTDFKVEPRAAD